MNVIISNERQNDLANLDIDIIKSVTGTFSVPEIVDMFSKFFYSKMILDVTALKQYSELSTYEALVKGLDSQKIIFLLPKGSNLCTPNFLGHLISLGIYNFTTDLDGIKFLLNKPNTLQDVEHIQRMSKPSHEEEDSSMNFDGEGNSFSNIAITPEEEKHFTSVSSMVSEGVTVIGIRNVTDHAGASTFIYMLKKELCSIYGNDNVVAIEVERNDFQLFNDKNMISAKEVEIRGVIQRFSNAKIILVDLNLCKDDSFCGEVLYLLEPSTIQLNKILRRNRGALQKIENRKVILNKSMLQNNDVHDFESEAGIRVFYNMPPLDERKRNAIVNDFLARLGLTGRIGGNNNSLKIFGLFRR